MIVQKALWGEIQWLDTDTVSYLSNSMSIGIATILPFAKQKMHFHYENEQFLYFIEGNGIQYVNGELQEISPGYSVYIPPNATHQIINTGEISIKHLVVTVYVANQNRIRQELPDIRNYRNALLSAIDAVKDRLEDSKAPAIVIVDENQNLVYTNQHFPKHCLEHCTPLEQLNKCPCLFMESQVCQSTESVICPHGLVVTQSPIMYGEHLLGNIYSAFLFMGEQYSGNRPDMYETSIGTLRAIQTWVNVIIESIVHFCSFDSIRSSLQMREKSLTEAQTERQFLEKNLRAMQNKVLNLHMDRHFLFNSLNAIGAQALTRDADATYHSITDLSRLLRYSSQEDRLTATLGEEYDQIGIYLHMQKLRFVDTLQYILHCPKNLRDAMVPFFILQPVVENAFTHAFTDRTGEKTVNVSACKKKERIEISIFNNGDEVSTAEIEEIKDRMKHETTHGMSMVYSKLQAMYGDDFALEIASDNGHGTSIILNMPLIRNGH